MMVDAQAVTTNHPGSERKPPPGWLSIRCTMVLPFLTTGIVGSCSRSRNGDATGLPFRCGCNVPQSVSKQENQEAPKGGIRAAPEPQWMPIRVSTKKKSFSLSGIDPDQPPVSHQSIDLSMPVRVWASLWAGVSVRGKTPGHIAEALRQPICSTKVHNCTY